MKPIDLAGFEAKFGCDTDPWQTWTNRDEAVKRDAIVHALGPARLGRMLEVAAGNGSNSRALASRALRLDATEATKSGTALVAAALHGVRGARAIRLIVPATPPTPRYDAIVIAELLYYLSPKDMRTLARQVTARLRLGGVLVLAHHRITFYDFVQRAEGIHDRFLNASKVGWQARLVRQTGRWAVLSLRQGHSL